MKPSRMKISENSITKRLLMMKFASECIPIYGVFTIMFGDRGGVGAAGIGFILAIGFVLAILFEIPTGIFADKVPRKYVLQIAAASKGFGPLTWLLFPSLWGFVGGTAFFALGTALESGALQAYLYGTLGTENKKAFGKFWSRMTAMVMVSYSIAYALATLIGVNYPLLLVLSTLSCVIAISIGSTLPKDTIITGVEVKPKIFASAIGHIAKSRDLIRLLMGSILIIALADMMIEYMALYYHQLGVPTRFVSSIFIPGNFLGAALFWTMHSWEGFLNKNKVLLLLGFTLLFVSTINAPLGIALAGFIIFSRMIRVLQVQFESNIQHLASDEARATITSIGAFISKLATAGAVLAIGLSAHNNTIIWPFRIALLVGVAIFIMIQLAFRLRDSRAANR